MEIKYLLIFILYSIIAISSCENNINILIVSDSNLDDIDNLAKAARQQVQENDSTNTIIHTAVLDISSIYDDSVKIVQALCNFSFQPKNDSLSLNESDSNQQRITMVLDITTTTLAGAAVKSFAYNSHLPVVTTNSNTKQIFNVKDAIVSQSPMSIISELIPILMEDVQVSRYAVVTELGFPRPKHTNSIINKSISFYTIPRANNIHKLEQLIADSEEQRIQHYVIMGNRKLIKNFLKFFDKMDPDLQKKYNFYIFTLESNIECGNCPFYSKIFMIQSNFNPKDKDLILLQNNDWFPRPVLISFYYYGLFVKVIKAAENYVTSNTLKQSGIGCSALANNNQTIARYMRIQIKFKRIYDEIESTFDLSEEISSPQFNMDIKLMVINLNNDMLYNDEYLGLWPVSLPPNPIQWRNQDKAIERSQTVFIIATVLTRPYIFKTETGLYIGYFIDVLNHLSKIMKFTFIIKPFEVLGQRHIHGEGLNQTITWDGAIGSLMRNETDMIIGPFMLSSYFDDFIDFSIPIHSQVGFTFVMKRPTISNYAFNFLSVVEDKVWYTVLASFGITSILMWIFFTYNPQRNRTASAIAEYERERNFTFKESCWFCFTSITPQGGGNPPHEGASLIVAGFWWFFGFIVVSSYSANLAAFLTVYRLKTPTSLEDFTKQTRISYSTVANSETYYYFQNMKDIEERMIDKWKAITLNKSLSIEDRVKISPWTFPLSDMFIRIWYQMEQTRFPSTLNEALNRVLNTSSAPYAFAHHSTIARFEIGTDCNLMEVGKEFSRRRSYVIFFPKGSRHVKEFNPIIEKFRDKGKMEKIHKKWHVTYFSQKRKVCQSDEDQGLTLTNVGIVFYTLFIGIGIAIIVIFFEYFYYRTRADQEAIANN